MAGVLLAAGSGSRLGRPKALVVVGGKSMASRGITLLRDGGTNPVIVVTGATGPDTAVTGPEAGVTGPGTGPDDRGLSVISVHNPDWPSGMGSSLAVGLGAVPDECTAVVLALADQPLVGPQAVRRLLAAYAAGAGVAVACYDGRPRNPVLISREHWPAVIALASGDVGARPFLRAHQALVTEVECGDTGRPDDVDSPEDLARIEALLAGTAPFPS
ncbi:MAG TPA: nucleotidyltransferase family protein [Streptosporangiaceae bacterium]|nr:nucleotidyltransferase family protein [Streptosporangiaceae bacterium]